MPTPDVALIVESFNETEHSSIDRLAQSLEAAERAAREHGDARVLLADGGGNPRVAALLAERFPGIERVPSGVCDYDAAKGEAARAADAAIVAYLDGDCLPTDDGWLSALVAPIASGEAVGATGSTQYEGGWLAKVLTVMDFGFLLPLRSGPVGCYASNNAAFSSAALAETPAPDGDMRCRCYAHAQTFERKGTPLHLAPAAQVRHEQVPLIDERLRRGWDLVTAARVDPQLEEAQWLSLGVRAAPRFWWQTVRWDIRRVRDGGADVGLGPVSRIAAIPVMAAVRLVDMVGIVAALRGKPVPHL
jgi:hypothetical protein